jgi:hypothetical protein
MVPWQDILSVRNSIIGGSRHKIIIVRRLTLIHHIFGLMYGFTTKPAFQLTSELNGFQEIMKVIKQKTEGQIES